jgi:predicted amidohydrolase
MRLIGVQLDTVWEDKAATFERIARLLDASPPAAGAMLVLPETFSTGFSMNVPGVQEGSKRAAEQFLEGLARQYGIYVLGGVVNLGPDGKGRNQAVAYSPQGRELARYDKNQPFTLGGESANYTAGTTNVYFDWAGMKVCPTICYDLRFPEIYRRAVRERPQLFAVIANWPAIRDYHWVTLLQARAIENQAWVIGVNRCGTDPKHTYSGRSLIVDPHGRIVVDAGGTECLFAADVDPKAVDDWRQKFPVLEDMKG